MKRMVPALSGRRNLSPPARGRGLKPRKDYWGKFYPRRPPRGGVD